MIGVLIILSLTSATLSKKYYLDNGVRFFSKIPSNQTNIFYTKGKPGSFAFTLTMKKMNETPFNFLYYDTWSDYYDNPTFSSYIDFKSYSTISDNIRIFFSPSSFGSNYVGIKFTPDYDLENVNIVFAFNRNDLKDLSDEISEFISSIFSIFKLILIIGCIIGIIITIVVVLILIIVETKKKKKKVPPPQFNNNNPNQQQNLPPELQSYSPPQLQDYPPPQSQIEVQPQVPPIQASTQ